jgi:hypothetical protein
LHNARRAVDWKVHCIMERFEKGVVVVELRALAGASPFAAQFLEMPHKQMSGGLLAQSRKRRNFCFRHP